VGTPTMALMEKPTMTSCNSDLGGRGPNCHGVLASSKIGLLAVTNLDDFFSDFLNQILQKLLSNFKINYEQQRCFFTERA
jgi:hypothetical protein